MVLKEKEIYNKLTHESCDKIENLEKKADTTKLVFKYEGNTADVDFKEFDNAVALIDTIKDGNNSESLLNKITQIVCPLYQSKEITKKVYYNITRSIKV